MPDMPDDVSKLHCIIVSVPLSIFQARCKISPVTMSHLSEDIELASLKKESPIGFATVAAFIANDRDNTTTIYRRFDRLSARSLLHLQSKLQKLEAVQDQLDAEIRSLTERNSARPAEDWEDFERDGARAATSWEDFETLAKTGENERRRMETAEKIEKAIKAYRE